MDWSVLESKTFKILQKCDICKSKMAYPIQIWTEEFWKYCGQLITVSCHDFVQIKFFALVVKTN